MSDETKSVQHTAGPWHLSPNFGYVRKNTGHTDDGPKDFNIASIHDFGEEAEVVANARLIAAAPELLEELETVVAIMNWEEVPPTEEKFDAIIARAEAAIRKAKGVE